MVTLLHHISVFINWSMAYTPPSLIYLTGFRSVFGWLRHSKQVASRHGNTNFICSCSVPMLFCLFLVYVLSLFKQISHALSYKSDSLKGYLQSHYCEWWRHLLYWSSAHCKYSTHGKIRIILCILSKYWELLYSSFVHVLGLRLCMYITPYLYLSLHTLAPHVYIRAHVSLAFRYSIYTWQRSFSSLFSLLVEASERIAKVQACIA
jgi:hypothetical protein